MYLKTTTIFKDSTSMSSVSSQASRPTPMESEVEAIARDEHQPNCVQFKKMHSYEEDRNLIAAEKFLKKLNEEWVSICQNRVHKTIYRDTLHRKLRIDKQWGDDREWERNQLKLLHISLDKLQFANNSSRGRSIKPCSSVKEIDHHSLHFGLFHGIKKNLSEEKQILRKMKEAEKDFLGSMHSLEDYVENINRLKWRRNIWPRPPVDEVETINKQIQKLEQQREEEIASCAVKGKMWSSLGTKEDIMQKIKSLRDELGIGDDAVLIKKLSAAENDLRYLDK